MIGEHPCYHQAITGAEAERRLEQAGGHCYLTRYSKKHKCYILSVYEYKIPQSNSVMEHFPIVIQNGKVGIKNKTLTFADIRSLLSHYEEKRIDPTLKSIGSPLTERQHEKEEWKRLEAIRQKAEREEAARQEAERQRQEAERLEAKRQGAERQEAERQEAERQEAERQRQEEERLEAERQEAERQEAERLEAERQEAERQEAERPKRNKCTIL